MDGTVDLERGFTAAARELGADVGCEEGAAQHTLEEPTTKTKARIKRTGIDLSFASKKERKPTTRLPKDVGVIGLISSMDLKKRGQEHLIRVRLAPLPL